MSSTPDVTYLIVLTGVIGIIFALYLMGQIAKVKLEIGGGDREMTSLVEKGTKHDQASCRELKSSGGTSLR